LGDYLKSGGPGAQSASGDKCVCEIADGAGRLAAINEVAGTRMKCETRLARFHCCIALKEGTIDSKKHLKAGTIDTRFAVGAQEWKIKA